MTPLVILQMFILGVVSSFLGSMAAGSGMIAVPFLMVLGLSPTIAVGTNKIADVFRFGSAAVQFCRVGKIDFKLASVLLPIAIIGGYLGSLIIVDIEAKILRNVIGVILIVVPPVLLLAKAEVVTGPVSVTRRNGALVFYFLMTVYAGSIQLGAGPAVVTGLVKLLRLPILVVSATTSFCALFLTVASLITFVARDLICWGCTVPLVVGALIGGTLGARFAIRKSERWLRIFFTFFMIGLGSFLLLT